MFFNSQQTLYLAFRILKPRAPLQHIIPKYLYIPVHPVQIVRKVLWYKDPELDRLDGHTPDRPPVRQPLSSVMHLAPVLFLGLGDQGVPLLHRRGRILIEEMIPCGV